MATATFRIWRGNADGGRAILMNQRDTSFAGSADEVTDEEVISAFREAGGSGPLIGQLSVCVQDSEEDALATVREWWANAGLKGTLSQELPLPSHFAAASVMVGDDALRESVTCGSDVEAHVSAIASFRDAGIDHVYVHQIGPRVLEAIEFYATEVMPSVGVERGSALLQSVAA